MEYMSLVPSHRILIVTILLQIGSSWQRQRVFPDDLDVHDPVPDLRVPGAGQTLRSLPVIVEQPRPSDHDRCRACDWSRVTIKASDWSRVTMKVSDWSIRKYGNVRVIYLLTLNSPP